MPVRKLADTFAGTCANINLTFGLPNFGVESLMFFFQIQIPSKYKKLNIDPIKVPIANTKSPKTDLNKNKHMIIDIGIKTPENDENLNSLSMFNSPLNIEETPQNKIHGNKYLKCDFINE